MVSGDGRSGTRDRLPNSVQYAAYVLSFLTIGIIWINHHAMIGRLRAADHSILILLLLMTIAVLPFATSGYESAGG